jgi:hypothetical protein
MRLGSPEPQPAADASGDDRGSESNMTSTVTDEDEQFLQTLERALGLDAFAAALGRVLCPKSAIGDLREQVNERLDQCLSTIS